MTFDPHAENLVVGIAGCGLMGRGIAQVAALSGCRVRLYDSKSEAARAALEFIGQMLLRLAQNGTLAPADAEAALKHIEIAPGLSAMADAGIVIEAIAEVLDAKRKLFAELEQICAPDAILASNTSSLSITAIAAACRNPERVAGLHFFNPVPLMKLVEVIDGVRGDPAVGDALMELATRFGREPVRVSDTPGFIVNQVGRGYVIEAAHIAAESVAPFDSIDRILREGVGFRMGPFELMDLTALDVTQPATEALYRQFFDEPRYRPTPLMRLRLDAGLLGRKVGRGFYEYDKEGRQLVEPDARMPHYDERWVWVHPEDKRMAARLKGIIKKCGGVLDENELPHPKSLLIVMPIGEDATTCITRLGLDPERTLAVDPLFGMAGRRTVMRTPATRLGYASAALGLFSGGGGKATLIQDSPGFIAQRVVGSIINIACAVAQSGVATPEDIDRAVVLGLSYPKGPLSWGDDLGAKTVLHILEGIQTATGDPRYRPAPWLRRRAQLGISLLTPDG